MQTNDSIKFTKYHGGEHSAKVKYDGRRGVRSNSGGSSPVSYGEKTRTRTKA